jgi:excisionase family DNA binding protein
MIGVSRWQVYALIRAGELPSLKIGRLRRIRTDRITEYLERVEAEQNGVAVPPTQLHGGRSRV